MCIPNSPRPPSGITCSFLANGLPSYQCTANGPKIEMLTPKGEHSIPLFYQGDVRWENHFRRLHNRQKLCDWILNFPAHSSQVKNPAKNKPSKHRQP